jgi:Polyketide cyclase / dehydrase and lipid transport
MRTSRAGLAALLLAGCAGLPVEVIADDPDAGYDTSWIDFAALAKGDVVYELGKGGPGTVTIEVAVLVHADRQTIWDLLKACEVAPEYVPNVVACRRIDEINDGSSELFVQTVKPAFFVPRFEHVFRLDYFPYDRIEVHRVSGPIAEMDGAWRLITQPGGAIMLIHSLALRPGIPIPRVFVRATLKKDLPIVLTSIRDRAEAASPN